MKLGKVTTKGRVTIPLSLRKKYRLTPRRKVRFEPIEDGIKIIPLATPKEIEVNIGFLGTNVKLLKTLMDEKKKDRN